jgi:alkyl hydroperoxide reductase subunit AhpC
MVRRFLGVYYFLILLISPVCTTELGTVANYYPEFVKRNTKVIALSVDGLESHLKWIKDIEEVQNVTLQYPIIADESKEVANLYDMIHQMQMIPSLFVPFFIIGQIKSKIDSYLSCIYGKEF